MRTMHLEAWRRRRFLSQDELAEQSGVSKRTIVALESAHPPQSHGRTVRKLAGALGIEPDQLFQPPTAERE